MIVNATSEAIRLASTLLRRVDTGLAGSAARNAEVGVLASHRRLLEEVRVLGELHALALHAPRPDVARAAARPRERQVREVAAAG